MALDEDGKFEVRSDRILFFDLEITCWEHAPPEGEEAEIVEIGIAELDVRSLEVTRAESYFIRPTFSRPSAFFTGLTGITDATLRRHGLPFAQACAKIAKDMGSRSKQAMSWGPDLRALRRDLRRKNVASPFSAAVHDFGLEFKHSLGLSGGVGLTSAMNLYGLVRSGRVHSGRDDAADTARLWAEIARRRRREIGVVAPDFAAAARDSSSAGSH